MTWIIHNPWIWPLAYFGGLLTTIWLTWLAAYKGWHDFSDYWANPMYFLATIFWPIGLPIFVVTSAMASKFGSSLAETAEKGKRDRALRDERRLEADHARALHAQGLNLPVTVELDEEPVRVRR